ncbi:hypothetical protein DW1_0320 [Proteiniborus sp. DW1]|uniref:hypothetical protein n=1 Tax=Proteiniborus sp. DW1 TaxID=1889883 RepID=UPI00092E159B|nr:hypothetical protein [Proteiniborus sp. DW1]SCG81940.1 hypothetical protein DW1_0320 [Proteiniborus sp. DW1]
MNTENLNNKFIMLDKFIENLKTMFKEDSDLLNNISEQELINALDDIGKDLVYNYLIFGKEVSFKVFVSNLEIYLNILKTRL